mmetsp:Transcript_19240/g.46325  ORF Transcript_19240/g.46325 Transcript_19240/m.46325 type:complete len:473 (+) Transcript_19240:139-1557(+)
MCSPKYLCILLVFAFGDEARNSTIEQWPGFPDEWDQDRKLYSVKLQKQRVAVGTRANQFKTAYFGWVSLGTPAGHQIFSVVFDTGSAHLVIPSATCQSKSCTKHRRFWRKRSSSAVDINHDGAVVTKGSARDQLSVSYGTGEVVGIFVSDTVCLGMQPRLEEDVASTAPCSKMHSVLATAMSDQPFASFAFDGVLGLALPGLSETPAFNFVDQLAKSGRVQSGMFSLFLATEHDKEPAELTFGGVKSERMQSPLQWASVLDPQTGYWLLPIKAVRIAGEELPSCADGACRAVVDTGTSLIAAPKKVVKDINQRLQLPLRHAVDAEEKGCSPDVPGAEFEFVMQDDVVIQLKPSEYGRVVNRKRGKTSTTLCEAMLMSMDVPPPLGPNLFIIGEPIFKKYYTVFDPENQRVGFSLAKHAPAPDLVESVSPLARSRAAKAKAAAARATSGMSRWMPAAMMQAFSSMRMPTITIV